MRQSLRKLWSRLARSGVLSLLLMVLVIFSFRSAVADWNDVPTGSMRPTIMIGDRIFVNKLAYDLKIPFTDTAVMSWGDPERGDIITCWSPNDGVRLVKRVVAIPGDSLAMKGGQLFINGQGLEYELTSAEASESIEGRVFFTENLTGLQHTVAHDPYKKAIRDFGFLDRSDVCGKVEGVVFSLDHDNYFLPRADRFFADLI